MGGETGHAPATDAIRDGDILPSQHVPRAADTREVVSHYPGRKGDAGDVTRRIAEWDAIGEFLVERGASEGTTAGLRSDT